MDYRIVSIGSLGCHELWGEQQSTRTAHATCTLVHSGKQVLLIDPGLPPPVIAARLKERSGLEPSAVSAVFLTNFSPAHRWGLTAFDHAVWYIAEMEREAVGAMLIDQFKQERDTQKCRLLKEDLALLQRCKAAPDRLADQVDLFPLPGFTPGTCGLLLLHPNSTTLVAGDAVATVEHLEKGQVLRNSYDLEQARDSLVEAIEIADALIPGHDNLTLNPTRRPM